LTGVPRATCEERGNDCRRKHIFFSISILTYKRNSCLTNWVKVKISSMHLYFSIFEDAKFETTGFMPIDNCDRRKEKRLINNIIKFYMIFLIEIRKIDQRDTYIIRRLCNYAAKYCTVVVTKGKYFIKIKRKLQKITLNTIEILKKMYVCRISKRKKKFYNLYTIN